MRIIIMWVVDHYEHRNSILFFFKKFKLSKYFRNLKLI